MVYTEYVSKYEAFIPMSIDYIKCKKSVLKSPIKSRYF